MIEKKLKETSPEDLHEKHRDLLLFLSSAMDAMKNVLPNHIELVLHDLTHPEASIVKIINGKVTCREEGDPLLKAPDENDGFSGMLVKNRNLHTPFTISGYNCKLKNGRSFKSGSTTFYNDAGEPIAAFAVNISI